MRNHLVALKLAFLYADMKALLNRNARNAALPRAVCDKSNHGLLRIFFRGFNAHHGSIQYHHVSALSGITPEFRPMFDRRMHQEYWLDKIQLRCHRFGLLSKSATWQIDIVLVMRQKSVY